MVVFKISDIIYETIVVHKTARGNGAEHCTGILDNFKKLTLIKELAIAWILCGRLHS